MSSSREESPDWLRSFQAPTQSAMTLSSGSDPHSDDSPPVREDEKENDRDDAQSHLLSKTLKAKSPTKKPKAERKPVKKRKTDNHLKREGNKDIGKSAKQETSEKPIEHHEPNHLVWALSSDSESCPDTSPIHKDNIDPEELSAQKTDKYPKKDTHKDAVLIDTGGESPLNQVKGKSPKKRLKTEDHIAARREKVQSHINGGKDGDMEVAEEEISEKHVGPYVSSSRLPLVLSDKVQRSKALVECEGESIDLSGDVGAVGRMVISDDTSRNHEMFIDLKGTIYKTTIVPSRTFCVVNFGQSEAKIEAIMNDFIQLKPQSNVYEAETMVEGTLDGFSFDSGDEADNLPKAVTNQTDQVEGAEEKSNKKARGRAEKTSGTVQKKGKTAGRKPPKKVKKKPPVAKKTKTKK